MSYKLLIVESPAKCKKIQEFLGSGWRVRATMGHIRALKEDLTAIGFRTTWLPTYEAISAKSAAIAALRRDASGASQVYLGSDDDREGEAIAWHVCALLGLDPATTPRVTFHEITAAALHQAIATPTRINTDKFNAQQARSMLDMLIGFTLSPCLWRGVGSKPGLSAGRCQTPALRLVYDRDQEIAAFSPTVSWKLTAQSPDALQWHATAPLEGEAAAAALLASITAAPHTITITDRQERVSTSHPPVPFITSSLQQEASNRLGMAPKATMKAAQTLYEAGHITYMRTDNAVLSEEARAAAEAVVTGRWGAEYLQAATIAHAEEPVKKTVRKKKTAAAAAPAKPEAQAAHEGIRPTHLEIPELTDVTPQEARLYALIWSRTVQSVMAPERRDVVKITGHFTANPTAATLQADWSRQVFAGWRALDAEKKAEELAAEVAAYTARAGLAPTATNTTPWTTVSAQETRSSPPSRYSEASLIQELEHRGIGRPSTYATLVETVLDRGYVEKVNIPATPTPTRSLTLEAGKRTPRAATKNVNAGGEHNRLRATALGRTVIEWLLATFTDMMAYDFTAAMESQLDEIAKGTRAWQTILTETWDRYKDRYDAVMDAPKPAASALTGGAVATAPTSSRVAEYGDGLKMVISRKGPLFVWECAGQPTRFAKVPPTLSIMTATRADAEAAFADAAAAAATEILGELEGTPVVRRHGPYGHYVQWGTVKLNCKPEETLTDLSARLVAKSAPDAVDHTVGPYRIRRGPYGLYMFKITTGTKKPVFVSIPEATPWATLTPETAEQVYKLASTAKKEAVAAKKPASGPRKKKASDSDA
jgi:DNA topoisomerase-1